MLYLKQVIRIERGSQSLVTLVIGHGIQALRGKIFRKVLPVNDFRHQEEVVAPFAHGTAQKIEKPFRQKVSDIQSQAVYSEFIYPKQYGAADIIHDAFVLQVELDKLHVTFPALIPKAVVVRTVAAKIQIKPTRLVRSFAPLLHVLKRGKTPSHMIENAVQHDADARIMEFFYQCFKFFVGTEAAVHLEKIDCIVAVPFAFKQRIEQNGIESAFFDIRDLLLDFSEAMADLPKVVFALCAAIAERIDLIKNTLVKPHDCCPYVSLSPFGIFSIIPCRKVPVNSS